MGMKKMKQNNINQELQKKRVLNLYRVSTLKQGTEDDIPVQRAECTQYAESNGWEVIEEITEKLSGFNTPMEERDALYKIRDMAQAGKIDIVLVYMSDRLGRQTELAGYVQGLAMLGVQVFAVKEGLLSGLEHNDNLMTYIKFWMAEVESKKTSARVKDSMKQMNEEGYYMGGPLPLGYTLKDTGIKTNSRKQKTLNKIVVLDEEAELVKLIFQLVHDKGYGASKIAQYMNNHGYTNRGKIFRHNSISRILRNPIYIGYKRYNVTEKVAGRTKKRHSLRKEDWKLQPFNPDLCILPKSMFMRVQEIIDLRKNGKDNSDTVIECSPSSSHVLLSGMVYCGECEHKLKTDYSIKSYTRKTDGITTKSIVYRYMCHHSKNLTNHGKKQWGSKTIDKIVENQVINTLAQIDIDSLEKDITPYQKDHIKVKKTKLANLTKIIDKKEIALQNTNKELELFMIGESLFTKEQLASLLNKLSEELIDLRRRRKEIEEEINENEFTLQDIVSFKDKFQTWNDVYMSSDINTKKRIISSVVKKVVLLENKVQIHLKIEIQEALNSTKNKNEIESLTLKTDYSDRPLEEQKIESMTVELFGETYPEPETV